jgi:hypothetical protein
VNRKFVFGDLEAEIFRFENLKVKLVEESDLDEEDNSKKRRKIINNVNPTQISQHFQSNPTIYSNAR